MSEAKYAPGPWSENRYGEVMDVTGTPVVFSGGFSIGSVTGHPEREFNKTLAMTAPELLQALEWLMACRNAPGTPARAEAEKMALSVIAKAKGGAA